jgi:hypothetical protein
MEDLLGWLAGRWTVERAINGRARAFVGTADFTPGPGGDGATWVEEGHLELEGYAGRAFRTLLLAAAAAGDPDAYEVRFDDGRPFHPLRLEGAAPSDDVIHHCGEDVYRGTYTVEDDDTLRVVWHVDGPRKRDVIASVYRRAR